MTVFSYAFRVDASTEIGHGHLMRCLTIADMLSKKSLNSCFVSRELSESLHSKVTSMGHELFILPTPINESFDWKKDSALTKEIVDSLNIKWLIVDHYSIDYLWEQKLKSKNKKLMVIDDLANRAHDCDVLLDQNLGRTNLDYVNLVPEKSNILAGLDYCLIRDEFINMRSASLQYRENIDLKNILISMGGSDPQNITTKILQKLNNCSIAIDTKISILLERASPHISSAKEQLSKMPWETKIYVDVQNMAKLLATQDLVIGAVGTSAWERCCLGIPSISVVLAENQKPGAIALHQSKGSIVIDQEFSDGHNFESAIAFFANARNLIAASKVSADLVDGYGAKRVIEHIQK